MRRTCGTQLTIDEYTQLVAPLDVRDLDLLPGLAGLELVGSATRLLAGEFGDDGRKGLGIIGADDHVTESPSFAAA